ncbi:MAG: hypothetical protein AAF485_32455, partial [Chloroflexota bacterium]
ADGLSSPHVRILARYEWTNVRPDSLHSALYEILVNRWKVNRLHSDATGIGATGTALLKKAIEGDILSYGSPHPQRVVPVTFDAGWQVHSRLAFNYLAMINGGRLLDYAVDFSLDDVLSLASLEKVMGREEIEGDVDRHAWYQRAMAKLAGKSGQKVKAYVPDEDGHDDILISEMLMVDAAFSDGLVERKPVARSRTVSRGALAGVGRGTSY